MNDCPCVQCICVPMCRHKTYGKIIQCSILFRYIYKSNDSTYESRLERITEYESRLERITEAFKIPIFCLPGTKIISQAMTFGNEKPKNIYD